MKTKNLPISTETHTEYKRLCLKYGISIVDATEKIVKNVVSKQINPANLDYELQRYHNYTVGFLKTFEKNQVEFLKIIISKLIDIHNKESMVETIATEILINSQATAKLIDSEVGDKLIKINKENIQIMKENTSKINNK